MNIISIIYNNYSSFLQVMPLPVPFILCDKSWINCHCVLQFKITNLQIVYLFTILTYYKYAIIVHITSWGTINMLKHHQNISFSHWRILSDHNEQTVRKYVKDMLVFNLYIEALSKCLFLFFTLQNSDWITINRLFENI